MAGQNLAKMCTQIVDSQLTRVDVSVEMAWWRVVGK
jgi:hypothetical protein